MIQIAKGEIAPPNRGRDATGFVRPIRPPRGCHGWPQRRGAQPWVNLTLACRPHNDSTCAGGNGEHVVEGVAGVFAE